MKQEIFYITIEEMIQDLSIENLTDVLQRYNNYVVTFFETHDKDCEPVGLLEYFHNDYFTE